MEKNMKNIKAEFKSNGIYYTPPELAETLKSYVDFKPKKIYDPTVGQGNLLAVFDDDAEKYGQELYQDELDKAAERLKNFHGYCGDTLKDDGFPEEKFDLIVANPPFSIKWQPNPDDIRWKDAPTIPTAGKADYAFLLHILYHLADNGKAVCLQFPGILYRANREGKIRQWMIEQNYIERVVNIPGGTFVDTSIGTCVLVLNKNKTTTDIIFEDKELNKERTVSFEEVKREGFNLSVSTYVHEEYVPEVIDPVQLEAEARAATLRGLERSLDISLMVSRIEGPKAGFMFEPFLDQIAEIVEKYREKIKRMESNGDIQEV